MAHVNDKKIYASYKLYFILRYLDKKFKKKRKEVVEDIGEKFRKKTGRTKIDLSKWQYLYHIKQDYYGTITESEILVLIEIIEETYGFVTEEKLYESEHDEDMWNILIKKNKYLSEEKIKEHGGRVYFRVVEKEKVVKSVSTKVSEKDKDMYFIYHYIDNEYNLNQSLLVLSPYTTSNDINNATLTLYYSDRDENFLNLPRAIYEGKILGATGEKFSVFFETRKDAPNAKKEEIPTFICFYGNVKNLGEKLFCGTFTSYKTVSSGIIVLERTSKSEYKEKIRSPNVSPQIRFIVSNNRLSPNKKLLKDIKFFKKISDIAGVYEAYLFEEKHGGNYKFFKMPFEILNDTQIRYISTDERKEKRGHIVDYRYKNLIIQVEHQGKFLKNYYDLQIIFDLDVSENQGYIPGIYAGTEEGKILVGGRVILFKCNQGIAFEELEQEEYIDGQEEKINKLFSGKRGQILKRFFRGDMSKSRYIDPPNMIEKFSGALADKNAIKKILKPKQQLILEKDYEELIELQGYIFSEQEKTFRGYYYNGGKHKVFHFLLVMDFLTQNVYLHGLLRELEAGETSNPYVGVYNLGYEGLYVQLQSKVKNKIDWMYMTFYTGSNYQILENILGLYQGPSGDNNDRVGGEVLLVREDKRAKDVEVTDLLAEQYIISKHNEIRVAGEIIDELKDLKISTQYDLNKISHLVGTYMGLSYHNTKSIRETDELVLSKLIINDNYAIVFNSPYHKEQQCLLKINELKDIGCITTYPNKKIKDNFATHVIFKIPLVQATSKKNKAVIHIKGQYISTGNGEIEMDYIFFIKVDKNAADFEATRFSKKEMEDNLDLNLSILYQLLQETRENGNKEER